jgi:uncharacterized Rmd1/YagE family protein
MRCTAYCYSDSYNLPALFQFFKSQMVVTHFRDNIHLITGQASGDVFFFSYGVMVAWGLTEEEELAILEKARPFEIEPQINPGKDDYEFTYGDVSRIQREGMILPNKDVLTKLSVSYGLGQSTKLSVFEETVNKSIAQTHHLPEDLATKGKISLSRKEISQKIGELFIDRSSVNLHSDILDEPEFFWEYPEHQPIYRDTAKCFDIAPRAEVLNKRLTIVAELLEILSDQLNHQHSSTLEWTIIWLILIEVFLAIIRDVFHLI